jgi:hypothetical protein
MPRISDDHPLALLLRDLIHKAVVTHVASRGLEDTERYLTNLLLEFLHADRFSAITDSGGRPLQTLAELLMEGDVTELADSFERERQVHKHLGDLILFGLGVYPELVRKLSVAGPAVIPIRPVDQGRESYGIVSAFDHDPWAQEAETFRKLSEGFEDFTWVLRSVGSQSGLIRA